MSFLGFVIGFSFALVLTVVASFCLGHRSPFGPDLFVLRLYSSQPRTLGTLPLRLCTSSSLSSASPAVALGAPVHFLGP